MSSLTPLSVYSDYLEYNFKSDIKKWKMHRNRVVFGKQVLELWMFFPCKFEKGEYVILEVPVSYDGMDSHDSKKFNEYKKASEKCLFEGFEYCNKWLNTHIIAYDKNSNMGSFYLNDYHTVEDLVTNRIAELTDTAKKQLGL